MKCKYEEYCERDDEYICNAPEGPEYCEYEDDEKGKCELASED